MNRLLVTGASGFVGRHVLPLVTTLGWELHAATRGRRPHTNDPRITWHTADIQQASVATSLVEQLKPSHLLHLAWYAEHDRYWTDPSNEQWADATIAMACAFARHGGQRFVGAGSCAEYDWTELAGPCGENTTPLRPQTPYGRAKLRAWRGVESATAAGAFAAWARLFFLYGEGEDARRLIPSVARAVRAGERPKVSAGHQRRDYLHARDAARALVRLITSDTSGAINVGSGEAISVREIVELLCSLAGRPGQAQFGVLPMQVGEPALLVADITRLRATGWRPEVSLREGLGAVLATAQ